jgi:hypothetical protein
VSILARHDTTRPGPATDVRPCPFVHAKPAAPALATWRTTADASTAHATTRARQLIHVTSADVIQPRQSPTRLD